MKTKIAIPLACLLTAMVVFISASRADKEEASVEPNVKKLMQAAHKGKTSPLAIVTAQAKLDSPDWLLLEKNSQPLAELAAAIKDNQSYTSQPKPYVDAVKLLMAATKEKDVDKARDAVAGLTKSCAGCHRPE